MKALVFDNELIFEESYPRPKRREGEVLIRVKVAGICNTDIEITKGYMGFKGILGHEFVGVIEESINKNEIGRRVVGEINLYCGECEFCVSGLERHCPNRSVLGIQNKDGAFAEFLSMPRRNVKFLPTEISDEEGVFVEPLAACLEIFEQTDIGKNEEVLILGDGKLGLLTALLFQSKGFRTTVVGETEKKLQRLEKYDVDYYMRENFDNSNFDVVIDCTGSFEGIKDAMKSVKPRGTIILKSTLEGSSSLNLTPLVINEITLIGSRCGPFDKAIDVLKEKRFDVTNLITKKFGLSEGFRAFDVARERESLKVLICLEDSTI